MQSTQMTQTAQPRPVWGACPIKELCHISLQGLCFPFCPCPVLLLLTRLRATMFHLKQAANDFCFGAVFSFADSEINVWGALLLIRKSISTFENSLLECTPNTLIPWLSKPKIVWTPVCPPFAEHTEANKVSCHLLCQRCHTVLEAVLQCLIAFSSVFLMARCGFQTKHGIIKWDQS